MDIEAKPKAGQRSWTDAQRAEQSRKISHHQIWKKSTGPRTPFGKYASARNSYKHGRFTHEKKILRWYLRLCLMRLKKIRTHLNHENLKRENELIAKYGIPNPPRPATMAFYPYFKVHPLAPKPKTPKKSRKKSEVQEIFDYFTSLGEE